MKKTQEEIKKIFDNLKKNVYKKTGMFIFRNAEETETVLTVVSGKLETIKVAGANEVVLRNIMIGSSAETYIIGREKFVDRYEVQQMPRMHKIDGVMWTECSAKGMVLAGEYSGERVEFVAPWGEDMALEHGDYLASPVNGSASDIYRIERDTFKSTYKQ